MDALQRTRALSSPNPIWRPPLPHATGAKHRLHRDLTGRFGSAKYAMDEVIVELTDSFVMANLGTRPLNPAPSMLPTLPPSST